MAAISQLKPAIATALVQSRDRVKFQVAVEIGVVLAKDFRHAHRIPNATFDHSSFDLGALGSNAELCEDDGSRTGNWTRRAMSSGILGLHAGTARSRYSRVSFNSFGMHSNSPA